MEIVLFMLGLLWGATLGIYLGYFAVCLGSFWIDTKVAERKIKQALKGEE